MTKSDKKINQIIYEAIHGAKAKHHEVIFKQTHVRGNGYYRCVPCDKCVYDNGSDNEVWEQDAVESFLSSEHDNPIYLEHNKHWGELLNWAKAELWWDDFEDRHLIYVNEIFDSVHLLKKDYRVRVDLFANPRSLAEHIVEYLKVRR